MIKSPKNSTQIECIKSSAYFKPSPKRQPAKQLTTFLKLMQLSLL